MRTCHNEAMKHTFAILIGIVMLASPALAGASTDNDALTSLYAQLIVLLKQELIALQPTPILTIAPASGQVPLAVTFTLASSTLTEAIDFGDGHSTGSGGCQRNMIGFCDLSAPTRHTYAYPGAYTVTLYKHVGLDPVVVSTQTVTVTK